MDRIRCIISRAAFDAVAAHSVGMAEPEPAMPGYVWVDLDDDIYARIEQLAGDLGDDAQSEADALSAAIFRITSGMLGHS